MEPESKSKAKIDSRGVELRIGEAKTSYAKKWPLMAENVRNFLCKVLRTNAERKILFC
jgi:hypothetical protein